MWCSEDKNEVRTYNFYYFSQLDGYLQNVQFSSFNHSEANIKGEKSEDSFNNWIVKLMARRKCCNIIQYDIMQKESTGSV